MVQELTKRNLTSTVAQYFLHDDDAAASGAVEAAVRWLHANVTSQAIKKSATAQCLLRWLLVIPGPAHHAADQYLP